MLEDPATHEATFFAPINPREVSTPLQIPFSIFKYVEPNTGRAFDQYQHGLIPIYVKHVKYSDSENDPFYLVYASPSFYSDIPGAMTTVLIYKINPDYTP